MYIVSQKINDAVPSKAGNAHLWLVPGVLSPEERVGVVVHEEEVGEGEREGRAGQPTQLVALQVQPPQAPEKQQQCT